MKPFWHISPWERSHLPPEELDYLKWEKTFQILGVIGLIVLSPVLWSAYLLIAVGGIVAWCIHRCL